MPVKATWQRQSGGQLTVLFIKPCSLIHCSQLLLWWGLSQQEQVSGTTIHQLSVMLWIIKQVRAFTIPLFNRNLDYDQFVWLIKWWNISDKLINYPDNVYFYWNILFFNLTPIQTAEKPVRPARNIDEDYFKMSQDFNCSATKHDLHKGVGAPNSHPRLTWWNLLLGFKVRKSNIRKETIYINRYSLYISHYYQRIVASLNWRLSGETLILLSKMI